MRNKCMIEAALIAAFVLGACNHQYRPKVIPVTTQFDPHEVSYINDVGDNEIKGKRF